MIPALVAIVLGTARVRSELDRAGQSGVLQDRNDLVAASTALTHSLQRERDLATKYLAGGRVNGRTELAAQQSDVDLAVPKVRQGLTTLSAQDETNRGRAQEAAYRLGTLSGLRSRVDSSTFSELSIQADYASVINSLLALTGTVAQATDDTSVQRTSAALSAIGRAIEQVTVEQATVLGAAKRGRLTPEETNAVRLAEARAQGALADFAGVATAEQRKLYSDLVDGPDSELRTRLLDSAVNNPGAVTIDPTDWDHVSQAVADRMIRFEANPLDDQQEAAQRIGDQAKTSTLQDAALVIGSLLVALALTLYLASLLLRPLWILRKRAFEVAESELPDAIRRIEETKGTGAPIEVAPVPIGSHEEIGQTARAFDAVHREAMRLATKQALLRGNVNDIFVNLSRRTQNLVEQQLALIDQMEDGEQDPDQMESLFRLDHLATRMRRNSENLLILAGVGLGRPFAKPVPFADMLRAAVSEVEQYQRVTIRQVPEITMQGAAAQDLVHLLAELLDNATVFSPPASEVILDARLTPADDVLIEVIDEGIGLVGSEVDDLNQRLAEPPEVDVAVSRRLGLYVVSRLAARHGITVRLAQNRGNLGTTAQVLVPAALAGPRVNGAAVNGAVRRTRPSVSIDRAIAAAVVPVQREPDLTSALLSLPPEHPGPALLPSGLPMRPRVEDEPEPEPEPVADPGPPTEPVAVLEAAVIYEELASAWFRAPEAEDSGPEQDWVSAQDELWRQAQGAATPQPDRVTESGLPVRRQGAQLIPGRAADQDEPPRSARRAATAQQEHLARYQEGLRRARQHDDAARE